MLFLKRLSMPSLEDRMKTLDGDLAEAFLQQALIIADAEGKIYALQRKTAILEQYRNDPAGFTREFLARAGHHRRRILAGRSPSDLPHVGPGKTPE